MKKWKVVIWASIACLFIAIAIQATFGGGIGLGIYPKDVERTPGSTITYTITVYNYQDVSDSFNVYVEPGSCDSSWFTWTTNQINSVPPNGGQKQIQLSVTPTKIGDCEFTVRAVSKSDSGIYASQKATIRVTLPPTCSPPPTCTPTPTSTCQPTCSPPPTCTPTCGPVPCNKPPTCIALTPDKSEPQDPGTVINWTACAYDPEGDQLWYRFWLQGPRTGWAMQKVRDWSTDNTWEWKTNISDIGESTIYVDVRDCHHANDSTTPDYDLHGVYKNYTIYVNPPPCCACLMPDKSEPMPYGTQINWSACAIDPSGDRDQLWYRFLLRGPNTEYWSVKQTWSLSRTWTWTPGFNDIGNNDIKVEIRDSFVPIPEYPEYYDVSATYYDYWIGPAG